MTEAAMDIGLQAAAHIPATSGGAYPARDGNRVVPLVDGEPAFRRICEAVEAARHSVWVTVAFLSHDFEMPDGRGSLFEVLDRAAARGVEVRALFWRVNDETRRVEGATFSGSADQRAMLGERASPVRMRWDRAQKGYCQHQKSWVIDAGRPGEVAFVGGINLGRDYVVAPGHRIVDGEPHVHDVYVEIEGPSAADVAHNFVQRWNEASDRDQPDGVWACAADDDLAFPERAAPPAGPSRVQIQRTVRAGLYADGRSCVGGAAHDIAAGELAIAEQYRLAIAAARRSIYIENQTVFDPDVLAALGGALERGVEVVALTPAEAYGELRAARQRPEGRSLFDQLAALGRHERFALVGVAGADAEGRRHNVYVHAKVMLVDDAWMTIGSCNIARRSFFGDIEINASVWDPAAVRALRRQLLAEHLDIDTGDMDDRAALALYRRTAAENRARRDAGRGDWQGLAFTLDPATYGE
ncbi:MAG: phosphatidylserine/phosphatidylglycerophosphate/cardiolipin synthase family protein [Proteobacteria bacterium]|nr:phosphatidylserine/phosphatidylglycerophosphate/cardiolipin synthase family protein [Pseudomonadota bacterium]